MPKVKAGSLKPAIDELEKTLEEKRESLSPAERRQLAKRLRRTQRKSRRIRRLEEARAPKPKQPDADAASGAAVSTAPAPAPVAEAEATSPAEGA